LTPGFHLKEARFQLKETPLQLKEKRFRSILRLSSRFFVWVLHPATNYTGHVSKTILQKSDQKL